MPTMPAVFAPNYHAFAETSLTKHTQFVAFAVALGNGLLAPATCDIVASISLCDIGENFILGHHDGVCGDFVHLEVMEKLDVWREDLM
jgi:hypothetical protein